MKGGRRQSEKSELSSSEPLTAADAAAPPPRLTARGAALGTGCNQDTQADSHHAETLVESNENAHNRNVRHICCRS